MVFEQYHFVQIKACVIYTEQPSLFSEFPRRTVLDPGQPDPQEKIFLLSQASELQAETRLHSVGMVHVIQIDRSLGHCHPQQPFRLQPTFITPTVGSSDNRVCITQTILTKGLDCRHGNPSCLKKWVQASHELRLLLGTK